MFFGTTPPDMRSMFHEHVRAWNVSEVWVGCSGNFTIERTLEDLVKVHGNDVNIQSCAVGSWLAGLPFRLEIRPEWRDDFGWLEPYLQDQKAAVATILLCSATPGPLTGLDRENDYYARMRAAYRRQWETLHAKTLTKLDAVTIRLESFFMGDVLEMIERIPDKPVVCFPPFYTGGYELLTRALATVFDWDEPDYPILDDGRHQALVEAIMNRRHWIYGSEHRREGMDEFLHGTCRTTNRGVQIYCYTNEGPVRSVRPSQKTEPVKAPRLGKGDLLGDRLALAPLTGGQFSALRSQYLNHNIAPGAPLLPLAVVADGKIIGAFAMSAGSYNDDCYLMSDFPVVPTNYPRLSKLVLYAALSTEAKRLFERATARRAKTLSTTAFTHNPVSMKYRGLLTLASRKPSTDSHFEHQLRYVSKMGRWTLAEGLEEWKKKHV